MTAVFSPTHHSGAPHPRRLHAFPDIHPGGLGGGSSCRAGMRWYPLLRRIAREVEQPVTEATPSGLDLLTRRLYAAYFHGHSTTEAWPPRTDAGTLCPSTDPDEAFVARLFAEFGGRHRLRRRLLGYLTVHGTIRAGEPAEPTVRCYLNLVPETAPAIFSDVATGLEHAGIAFAGKLLDNPANYGRPDAAVFYAGRLDAAELARIAVASHDPAAFGAEVPAFTREVAPGIAVADDPGDGISFGYHRCRLVAQGIAATGAREPHARLGAIIDTFLRAGVDPARPHLGPGLPELVLDGAAA
ncbi:MAG TPA: T3SS effector HopA1 family protein [Gryllotalpicola sp.]